MPDPVTPSNTPPPKAAPMRTYAQDVAVLTGKPLPKNVVNEPAPRIPTPEPPPAKIIPKAPSTPETKEQVLKRFAEAQEKKPVVPSPNTGGAPVSPFTPSAPVVLPKIEEAPPGIVPVEKPSPIHTYKTDFVKRTAVSGSTRFTMVAAEQDARGTAPVAVLPPKKKGNALLFVAGAILVLSGIGAIYASYRFATGNPPVPEEAFVPSLIFADERVQISGSGEELRQSLLAAGSASLGEGEVAVVYMTYATTTEAGIIEEAATGAELFQALRLPAPDILLRNIEPRSTLGVVNAGGEARPFFVLEVAAYDRTFAGMLEWEATMERDLLIFYPPFPEGKPATVASGTATSSPLKAPAAFRLAFVDEVLENRDVRVLRDADNRIIMLYGYRDKDTLIIARNTQAFSELLERLGSSRAR